MTRGFRLLAATVAVALTPQLALAELQTTASSDRFRRGVPRDSQPGPALRLSLSEAIQRGLNQNLGVLLEEQELRSAEGRRWTQLSGLLPDVQALVHESQQKVNLAAFGFTGFSGADIPAIIGPFNVFDARVALSQPLLDVSAIHEARAGAANVAAARHTYQDTRNFLTLVVTSLYFRELSEESRLENAVVELATAETLYQLAVDQKSAGLVARIDVLRADVERKSASQRRIVAENDLTRARLQLARAIGLPAGQEFTLSDRMPFAPLPRLDPGSAIERAVSMREDLRSARLKVTAAERELAAARGELLPSLHATADYGDIGATAGSAEPTYSVAANLRVPLFNKGRTQARVIERQADLAQRRAELADLQNGVSYDVQLALRDLEAAAEQVTVAESAVALATQALTQAQDRFRAGVASNIEVVQAQQAEAGARESHIASLFAHNLAKAALARALGVGEQDFTSFIGGQITWQKP